MENQKKEEVGQEEKQKQERDVIEESYIQALFIIAMKKAKDGKCEEACEALKEASKYFKIPEELFKQQ